jgi:hypothetical protein
VTVMIPSASWRRTSSVVIDVVPLSFGRLHTSDQTTVRPAVSPGLVA